MPFFQNVFVADYKGVMTYYERNAVPLTFNCPRNAGRSDESVISWVDAPFDLSGSDPDGGSSATLTLFFSFSSGDFKNWASITVDITASAASTSAVTNTEIVSALNSDAQFSAYFTAEKISYGINNASEKIRIKQNKDVTRMRFYIQNGNAEHTLRFNARAGVAELPAFFSRHTIAERFNFDPSDNILIELDPATYDVDAAIIDNATDAKGKLLGLDSSTVQAEWQLLNGRLGSYTFEKNTIDGSNRITQKIIYYAGAGVGDAAKKINYTYTGANTNPDQVTEVPYVLTSGDLVTP